MAVAVLAGITFALMTLLDLAKVVLMAFFGESPLVASEYTGYAHWR